MNRPLVLTYRTLGLGDLLTAVPALRAIRAAFPHHRHVLATPAWLGPLVQLIEAVDDHVAVDELGPVPDHVGAPEVGVVLHGSGPQSHRRVLEAEPGRMIAYRHVEAHPDPDAPWWDPTEHEVSRWCRLLAAYGIDGDPGDLGITAPADVELPLDAAGATLIHPGAKAPARRWPADRFAEVARWERTRGRTVVITGSADERPLALEVAARAGLDDDAVLAGRLDLAELTKLVSQVGRVVCGDTGVAHIATAVGAPSVVLFGPMSPARWGPPADRSMWHRALWSGEEGDPLADRPDAGLLELSVADVLLEIDALDRVTAPPTDPQRSSAS